VTHITAWRSHYFPLNRFRIGDMDSAAIHKSFSTSGRFCGFHASNWGVPSW
jgi:hypothetical protein